jgi:hypothetical protein
MQSMPENCLGTMHAASISQRLISHQLMKYVWTGWQFISLYKILFDIMKKPSLNSSPSEEHLNLLAPAKTYSTKSITSLLKELPIQSYTLSLGITLTSNYQQNQTFSKETHFFPLGFANECTSGGDVGSINLQPLPQNIQHGIF